MRGIILAAVAIAACDIHEGRPGGAPPGPGVTVPGDSTGEPAGSTGERPRLDLGDWPEPPGETSTGSTGEAPGTTGEPGSTGGTSTGGEATGSSGAASTGEDTSTGEPGSSSGDPPPLTPCPCAPEAAAAMNVCGLPPGTCPPVTPGGYYDPNGNHDFADGDWVLGWQEWTAKCG